MINQNMKPTENISSKVLTVEQIYTGCLAQGAYYIRSENEVAIIDPMRDTKPYLERANEDGAEIKYIFETHFHADFVSGHLDLSQKTNAPIVFGPKAKPMFDAYIAKDNEEFKIGKVSLVALHTPGHTLESTTYLLKDQNQKPIAIFTGDTLFLGDVGRPDLAQSGMDLTKEDLAGMLYDSITQKILPLPDEVIIYPGHGAGSACGKNMMNETVDSLGNQRQFNYALQTKSKEEFVKVVTDGLPPPPSYFPDNVRLNQMGYSNLEKTLEQGLTPLNSEEFESLRIEHLATVLDTREPETFSRGFIPGSINIGLDGQFAPWVGALLENVRKPLLLICPEGREEEAVTRLARVGFENIFGFLDGGVDTWKKSCRTLDQIERITPEEFANKLNKDPIQIWDVRRPTEFHSSHLKGALCKPLDSINEWSCSRSNGVSAAIHCAGGYRSMIAASILKAKGVHNFVEVSEGYNKIKTLNVDLEHSSTL